MDNSSDKNIKEDFCPVCIASVPLAFALVSSVRDENEKLDRKHQTKKRRGVKNSNNYNYIYMLLFVIFFIGVFYYYKK